MGKHQKVNQETDTAIIIDYEITHTPTENTETYTDLTEKLAKIRKKEGVIGYILRDSCSATINLDDPEKLVEYALLSSNALAHVREFSETIDIGDVETVTLEGHDIKAIFMLKGDNRIDLFMQKSADHTTIMTEILA